MPTSVVTCADVEARDLEAGYLAGRLSPEEAAAYEAHYFGCERCWPSLQRATELRAAFATASPATRRWLRPGLAAAAVLLLALAGWPVIARMLVPGSARITRGSADSVVVRAAHSGASFAASWSGLAGADRYRARLFAADGTLLFERETADTTVSVPADSLPGRTARMFWQVQALDALRQPLARSPLTPAEPNAIP